MAAKLSGSYPSSSQNDSSSSIEFEGNGEEISDDASDEVIAVKANRLAMNDLRIYVVKALINILVDGLQIEGQPKSKILENLFGQLTSLNIVPAQMENPIFNDVTNQIRSYMEILFVGALKNVPKEPSPMQGNDLRVETVKSFSEKIELEYFVGKNFLATRYNQDFKEIHRLGKGGFGSVFKAQKVSDGVLYALKKIALYGKDCDIKFCIREVQQMVQMSHQNVIRYFDSWTEMDQSENDNKSEDNSGFDPEDSRSISSSATNSLAVAIKNWEIFNSGQTCIWLYIQMELCDQTLCAWLERRNTEKRFHKLENIEMVKQILTGVEYFHDLNILHRDLKPLNILINYHPKHCFEFIAKITDFGLSRKLVGRSCNLQEENFCDFVSNNKETPETLTEKIGSQLYISPEQNGGSNYDFKSDIYSIGLMAYEIFWPMNSESEKIKKFTILKSDGSVDADFAARDKDLSNFVTLLTKRDPQKRPTAFEALSHRYISEISEETKLKNRIKSLEEKLAVSNSEIEKLRTALDSCTCQK